MALLLSSSQQGAVKAIQSWVANIQREKYFILRAGAGRGKTFLLANMFNRTTFGEYYIDLINAQLNGIIPTATTHVAITQVKEQTIDKQRALDMCTIHSQLGISPCTNKELVERQNPKAFKRSGYLLNSPVTYGKWLFIVDEAFRIDSELWAIMHYLYPDAYWLFLGDPFQTPPVGEAASAIEYIPSDEKIDFEMTVPMRFKNPELGQHVEDLLLVTKYREADWEAALLPRTVKTGDLCWKSYSYMRSYIDTLLMHPMLTPTIAIVCGTRAMADYYNKYIFNCRKQQGCGFNVHSDEDLIAEYHFNMNSGGSFKAKPEPSYRQIYQQFQDNVSVPKEDKKKLFLAKNEKGDYILLINGDDGKGLKGRSLSVLHGITKQYSKPVIIYRMNIAKTIHTAQGITSSTVFIDMPSIDKWHDVDMKRRLTYTAASRSSQHLYYVR